MQKQQVSKSEIKNFLDHEEENIFDIITARNKYKSRPFEKNDLQPDLVIKINVPQKTQIEKTQYLDIANFVTSPPDKLQRAYKKAEMIIIKNAYKQQKNKESLNVKLPYQRSFQLMGDFITKQTKIVNEEYEQQLLEIQCVNQFINQLDVFNLQYHTFVYMLQAVCGFNVRAFMLYDQYVQDCSIYLFLNIDLQNMFKVASKFRIKKEFDYTSIDFFMNQPCTSDKRPIKLNSQMRGNEDLGSQLKHINRYFGVYQLNNQAQDVVQEKTLKIYEEYRFLSCNQQINELFNFLKYKVSDEITNAQKSYIFFCNRRRINPGCQKYYSRMKKRRDFFELNKKILRKHGFRAYDEPVICEEFFMPTKSSKVSAFFHKLKIMLLYKAYEVSEGGQLSLFLPMQRIKLSYIILKSTFRIDFLEKMGYSIFALGNDFQKFGSSHGKKDGIDGHSLTNKFSKYSLFTDTKVVRDYFGDGVGYQIMNLNYIIGYLSCIMIPYIVMFALQLIWADSIWQYTSQMQAIVFAMSYSFYLTYLKSAEKAYSNNFQDSISSKVFLTKYRGPYIRNVFTDQVNQFRQIHNFWHQVINTLCILIVLAMLVIVGALFNACRFILRNIYDALIQYQIASIYLSLPHLIAYSIFLVLVKVIFNLFAIRIIKFMVYLQNSPSDQIERQRQDIIKFYYIVGIELVPVFFFFILEPFLNTSCYTDDCQNELTYYVYARFLISFGLVVVQIMYVIFIQYAKSRIQNILSNRHHAQTYQHKLRSLLWKTVKQADTEEHKQDRLVNVADFNNFAYSATIFPLSPVVCLLNVFIKYVSLRLALLYHLRRPINRSEMLIKFSRQATIIYYIGIVANSWQNVFALQLVETYLGTVIENVCNPLTEQNIFLLKLALFALYAIILVILGWISGALADIFSNNSLQQRKKIKFKQYLTSRVGLKLRYQKTDDTIPLKTIFRVKNQLKIHYQGSSDISPKQSDGMKGSNLNLLQAQQQGV